MSYTTHLRQGRNDLAVSKFIDEFWTSHYRSPTIREIARACNISSTSVASNTLQRVAKERGDVLATDGSARGITPRWVQDAIHSAAFNMNHVLPARAPSSKPKGRSA